MKLPKNVRVSDGTRLEFSRRLVELGIRPERINSHIHDAAKGNGILVIRRFLALEGSPWEGPIFQCFDPLWKVSSAFSMMMIEGDE